MKSLFIIENSSSAIDRMLPFDYAQGDKGRQSYDFK